MHILLIPSWYPSVEHPIGGIFFREQALALQKAGHRVGVLVAPALRSKRDLLLTRKASDLSGIRTLEEDQGLPTYRTSQIAWFPGFLPWNNAQLIVRAGMGTFEMYCRDHGIPDVLHAHSILYGGFLAARIGGSQQVPTVLSEHSSRILIDNLRSDQRKIVHLTLAEIDKALAVSAPLAQALEKHLPGCQVEVVENMVDTGYFTPGDGAPPGDEFIFCTIAGLEPKKGLDILVDAFARVFTGSPVRLRIVGDGSQRSALEEQVHASGIAAQVEFHGRLTREGVREALQQSHALVSASLVETFGISLIEALSCGKPVVATRSGGPQAIINQDNGILVQAADPVALAHGLQRMIREYQQFDPVQIRANCQATYSEKVIVNKLETIYESLVYS